MKFSRVSGELGGSQDHNPNLHPSPQVAPPLRFLQGGGANLGRFVPVWGAHKEGLGCESVHDRLVLLRLVRGGVRILGELVF